MHCTTFFFPTTTSSPGSAQRCPRDPGQLFLSPARGEQTEMRVVHPVAHAGAYTPSCSTRTDTHAVSLATVTPVSAFRKPQGRDGCCFRSFFCSWGGVFCLFRQSCLESSEREGRKEGGRGRENEKTCREPHQRTARRKQQDDQHPPTTTLKANETNKQKRKQCRQTKKGQRSQRREIGGGRWRSETVTATTEAETDTEGERARETNKQEARPATVVVEQSRETGL